MAVTPEQLRDYLNAPDAVTARLSAVLEAATSLVAALQATTAPASVLDQAVLATASDIYAIPDTPNGIAMFADLSGSGGLRVGSDVTRRARTMLTPWLPVGGIA